SIPHSAGIPPASAPWLATRSHCAGVLENEAAEHALWLAPLEQSRAPDEVALVELDGEAESGLPGRVLRGHVRAPHPVALLEPQRVDRLVAARDEAVRPAGLPERVPEPDCVLRG